MFHRPCHMSRKEGSSAFVLKARPRVLMLM